MAAENSAKIPTLLNQVLECIKSSKGDALVNGLKEVNQFFSSVNEFAFRQMGAQMSQSSSEGTSASTAEKKPEAEAADPKSQPQQPSSDLSSDPSSKQPQANQSEQSSTTASQTTSSKDAANGVGKKDESGEELGTPKARDGHVAVCSTSLLIKQIPKFWSDKKVRENAEEFGAVTRIDYKPILNTAVVTFKNRSDAYKALSGIPKTRPLSAAWELNSGIANSYFKKYWDANDGATFIPSSMFPWMKQKDLLLGGAFLLSTNQHAAAGDKGAAPTPANKASGTPSPAKKPNQTAGSSSSGNTSAPSSANKTATPSPAGKNAASTGAKSATNTPTQKNIGGSQAGRGSGSAQNSKQNTNSSTRGGSNSLSKPGNQSRMQGDIPSLFANDYTRAAQGQAPAASPRFPAPGNPPQQPMPQGNQQPRGSPSMFPNQVRPYGSVQSIGISGNAQQPSNPFASPASRAPAPGFSNIGQQQQQNAAFGKRNSLDSNSAYGGEIKRQRIDEPTQPVGRGYVPGRNASFETPNTSDVNRPDINRGPEFSAPTGRAGPQFNQPYLNPPAAVRPFGAPRPVSNQGLLQPPAANPRFGQVAPPPRPFRF